MNRVTRMFREPCAWLAVLGLAGCNQLEKIGDTDSGGGSTVPTEVRVAFEESCGKVGCHVAGGTAPTLTGGSLDALVGTEYVTIGDIAGSLIAVKMLPDATLAAFADHGQVRAGSVTEDVDAAAAHIAALEALGLDLNALGERLQADGLAQFATAFGKLLELTA